jgi:hypothetical protein
MRANPEALEALGLVLNDAEREVSLSDGVGLLFRPPEAVDQVVARAAFAKVVEADTVLSAAGKRYGWSAADKAKFADLETWETAVDWCHHVEIAARVVREIFRQVGEDRVVLEPTVENFRQLFRLGDNFDLFKVAARQAAVELIQPKKG